MARVDKNDAWNRAKRSIQAGRPQEALPYLWTLIDRTHLTREELNGYLTMLGDALAQLGRNRAAATVALFLGNPQLASQLSQGQPTDLARVALQAGDRRSAAQYFEQAGWLGHAAIQLEELGDLKGARVLWSQLASDTRLTREPYTQGLVRFNLGRAAEALDDRTAARRAYVESVHLLEAAADGFETQGLRERAFDCFQVIMALGKTGAFENLAEGYLNCIRILKEDGLKYYVLQYYEDFQKAALERGELHAAATLFREAAEFCRRYSMPYEHYYRAKAGETHMAAGMKTLESEGPVEFAENSFAAAIDMFNEVGLYSSVRGAYGRLATLPLGDKRVARYQRLQERLSAEADDAPPLSGFPDYLRMETAYPDIWRLDVMEWEQQGDPAETMGEVLQDSKWPDFTRRRALLCRLSQLATGESNLSVDSLVTLADQLGRVEIYACLAPLESLYEHDDPQVRAACLRAVRQLFFKRSFVLIMKGLRDENEGVRAEALEAVGALHFGHAFDPLSRIYRESSGTAVRVAALSSIGKIPSVAAAEFLVDAIRQAEPQERELAQQLLARNEHQETSEILHRAINAEPSGPIREALEAVFKQRRR